MLESIRYRDIAQTHLQLSVNHGCAVCSTPHVSGSEVSGLWLVFDKSSNCAWCDHCRMFHTAPCDQEPRWG